MNIFVLHSNALVAATMMCNKHVVKMILESAQMLSTAHYIYNSPHIVYRPTHQKHPCVLWICQSSQNYMWLFNHFIGLLQEYNYRYDKLHSCMFLAQELAHCPCPPGPQTDFVLAMPEHYKTPCPFQSYRNYYLSKGNWIYDYKKRSLPSWMKMPDVVNDKYVMK